ncbi:unnamed protein product [Cuscuta epithymum]|uniref:F-box domain-containing protein n=1 Tax=Cuscuta epithymum TaxID=186058 RepID=A0AAV0G351_9ASTE|nr:unnamed protein product [Cuscuta epithymum]
MKPAAEMSSDAPFLPIEIISNVLKRLPVKSLIQFQTVCNLWKNLINSPSFIASHLDHSDREYPSFIAKGQNIVSGTSIRYFLDRDMQLRQVQNNPLIDSLGNAMIVGSCNGLLCVQIQKPGTLLSLYFWNPAIREVMQVPRSRTIMDFCYYCILGFAFSPAINDYKIVLTYMRRGNVGYEFEVYSLATDSWKKIELPGLEGRHLLAYGVTSNGSMFWFATKSGLASHEEDNSGVIVSFDLAMDVFSLIPPPPLSGSGVAKLAVYADRLAVYHYSSALNTNASIDLWVIEEGIGGSWSKILTCGPYPPFVEPVTVWRNQFLFNVFGKYSVQGNDEIDEDGSFLFDPTSNEVKVLSSGRNVILHAVFRYVESLVLISDIHTGKH